MALPNPLAMLVDTTLAVARIPLRVAETVFGKAVGAAAGTTSKPEAPEQRSASRPAPEPAAPQMDPVEEIAKAAVAREMAEEPLGTTPKPKPAKPKPVKKRAPEPDDTRPLIDSGTAAAVRSEAETMQAAADVDKKG